jgi:crossover junction endodeoxyribonuclease RuvC
MKQIKEVILGIDPGTTRIGYGVIEKNGPDLKHLEYGCLKVNTVNRLLSTKEELFKLIKKYKPDRAAVEKLFFNKNVKTAMAVSEARGVIMLCLQEKGIHTHELTPLEVKQGISGYGQAGKEQVQRMVKLILKLEDIPKPDDAADALAIAICGSTLPIDF